MTLEQAVGLGALVAVTGALLALVWIGVAWARKGAQFVARFERFNAVRQDGSVKIDASFKEPQ